MINIVLVNPKIPHNTGAIGRLCVALGARLHLISPLGFSLDDKLLKRAGLDYWQYLDFVVHSNLETFWLEHPFGRAHFLLTTKARKTHYQGNFLASDIFLYFGSEDAGLPGEILKAHKNQCLKIPMMDCARSLNLAMACAIVAYEARRQRKLE